MNEWRNKICFIGISHAYLYGLLASLVGPKQQKKQNKIAKNV